MRRTLRIAGFVALSIIGLAVVAYVSFVFSPALSTKAADLAAKSFVSYCKGEPDVPLCYEERVPLLLHVVPLESVFSVVRALQRHDPSYRFCHVLGHELGVFLAKRDPERWMDLMHRNPTDGLCSNGFVHGVIVGSFNYAELPREQIDAMVPDLSRACEAAPGWKPSDLDRSMCYHALGHVLTLITGADLVSASDYCLQVASKRPGDSSGAICTAGVFMQIFQPLEPEDFALIERLPVKPTKENLVSFCSAYGTAGQRAACFGEAWPLFRKELKSAEGVQAFCELSGEKAIEETCYGVALAIGARSGINDPARQMPVCEGLPPMRAQQCVSALANAFIEEDRTKSADAVRICSQAPEAYREGCYAHLVRLMNFNFVPGSVEQQQFCAALPDQWRSRCTVPAPATMGS